MRKNGGKITTEGSDKIDASKALREAIDNTSDGDTIGVCGSLITESLCLGRPHGPAVRLIGMNAEQPWFFSHDTSWEAAAFVPKLQKAEKEADACLGFPSAHIHVESNCLEIYIPLWLERVRLTSGSRKTGGRARFFEEDDAKYLGKVSCRSLSLRGTNRSNDAAGDEKGVADLLLGLLCQPWKGVLL